MSLSFRNPFRRPLGVRISAVIVLLCLLLSFSGCDQAKTTTQQTESDAPTGSVQPGTEQGSETVPGTSGTSPVTTATVPPATETGTGIPDDLGGFAVSTSTS